MSDTDLSLRLAKALGWRTDFDENRGWEIARPDGYLVWPTSADGMVQVLEALQDRGWTTDLRGFVEDGRRVWIADFEIEHPKHEGVAMHVSRSANAPERAVAEAALAAVKALESA